MQKRKTELKRKRSIKDDSARAVEPVRHAGAIRLLGRLPVHGPAVLDEELLAGLLQVKVGAEVRRDEGLAGEGVGGGAAEVLHYGGPLVRLARLGLRRC